MAHSHFPDGPTAYVNHGRWLVHCVNSPAGCTVARQIVKPPKTMPMVIVRGEEWVCENCTARNPAAVFPRSWKAIEKALLDRKIPQTRNWLPGETVPDLERELAEFGAGVV